MQIIDKIEEEMPKKIGELKIMLITLAGKDSQDAKPYLEKLVNSALQKLDKKE